MRDIFGVLVALALVLSTTAEEKYPYAPRYVACPRNLTVRAASEGLSANETNWRRSRLPNVVSSLGDYLPRANLTGFDLKKYLSSINSSNVPVIGMAISGGGTQSGLGGLGVWQAFDERYQPAVDAGTGGLVQCLTYLSGLSGGGLLTVAPLASGNFTSLAELRKNVDLTTDYLVGPTGNQSEYFESLYMNMVTKFDYGFPVSVTDVFGQWFRQYLPKSWAYADYSDIATVKNHSFAMGLAPMPIVALAEVIPGTSPNIGNIMYPGADSPNLTNYELNPFEFGSWIGGRVQAFMSTKSLGSVMSAGSPVNKSECVEGFDKVTFAQGSTGNAFNFYLVQAFYNIPLFTKRDKTPKAIDTRQEPGGSIPIPESQQDSPNVELIEGVVESVNQTFNESLWATYPNPFLNYNKAMANVEELLIVDGSETGEAIPLRPLIVPERNVDFIIAFDASGDGNNSWVNGNDLRTTAVTAAKAGIPFPDVPPVATLVNQGLTTYPTFFGCNNMSVPLVLYLPNAPWSAYSNFSFLQSGFTNNQLDLVFNNSLDMVTFGKNNGHNPSIENGPAFATCIACAAIHHSLERVGMQAPEVCTTCFQQHCWNGTLSETPLTKTYDPSLILGPKGLSYAEWNATTWSA